MHPSFDVQEFRFAEAGEQTLKRRMTILTEGRAFPPGVSRWMGRIEVGARHKPCGNKFRRGVCAPMAQQPGQYMGMRAFRALTVRRRYRLVDLDASELANEHAMRIDRKNHGHRAVARLEQRPSDPFAKRSDYVGVAGANARIQL